MVVVVVDDTIVLVVLVNVVVVVVAVMDVVVVLVAVLLVAVVNVTVVTDVLQVPHVIGQARCSCLLKLVPKWHDLESLAQ